MPHHNPMTHARFWSKVEIPPVPHHDNLCWIWRGSTAKGYGQMKVHGEVLRSHRIAYEMFCGPIPDGMEVRHSCDNPLCVNPRHLSTGTHQENMDDKKDRGRVYKGGPYPREAA